MREIGAVSAASENDGLPVADTISKRECKAFVTF